MSDDIYIYPTDTVWGIGGNIHSAEMASKINNIKGYSEVKPLSILFCDLDMLSDYFQLELIDRDWLKGLFSLEATLGLPCSWLKKEIPSEIFGESEFVCVRVLNYPCIEGLINQAKGPVFTTSFNKKENPPITDLSLAKSLLKEICPRATLIEGNSPLSGQSSTIIVIDEQMNFSVLRAGTRVKEIEKHIKLLSA